MGPASPTDQADYRSNRPTKDWLSRVLAWHHGVMAALSRIGGRALADLLPDVRSMPGPVYGALARAITSLVLDGRVVTETRLPSERELATSLGLSRATVTAAYDQLRTDGFLASRTGSGSYATVPAGAEPR